MPAGPALGAVEWNAVCHQSGQYWRAIFFAVERGDAAAGSGCRVQIAFYQDWIDPIQRLSPDASNEDAYRTYIKNVRIGYDPTESVIRMEVIVAEPPGLDRIFEPVDFPRGRAGQ